MYDRNLLDESDSELAPAFIRAEEVLVSKYKAHVVQFVNMREHVKGLVKRSREEKKNGTAWSQRVIVQIADFAQNLDMPHFGSEQPGDIYYFSPLGIYLFGIVSPYHGDNDLLFCQYFTEGEGAKGGNNVSSLLWNSFKEDGFIERGERDGSMGEYALIMDNCGGQNKNRMVIRFLMLMTEIGIFKKASNVYLVRGHTKNACDRMFMLLKQHFHHKNVYTMDQLHRNLNENDDVNAVEIKSNKFFNLDELLDKYYKRPESGSVNRTHIFTMYQEKPGILELKDSTDSPVRTQNLKKGNVDITERKKQILDDLKKILPMKKPGIKPIKQIELGTKWRALVPEEYRDDVCPVPPNDIVEKYKREKKKNGTQKSAQIQKDPLLKMSVKQLKEELAKLKLPTSGLKKVLLERLTNARLQTQANKETNETVLTEV